ncbi:MAG: hypothetical protein SGPRY_012544, partial [Prymnesium sp.]
MRLAAFSSLRCGVREGSLLSQRGLLRLPLRPLSAQLKPHLRRSAPPSPERVQPTDMRRPFAQKNRRRDDVHEPRQLPAVPICTGPSVQAWLSSWDNPRIGIASLRADVWSIPLRQDIVHRVVFWQRACMRQGTAQTKGRGDVKGGGRKPRPQKGTGKSRQGSIRAPQWRGGAKAFPKMLRSYRYFLPRKVQTLGMKVALSDKYRRGALVRFVYRSCFQLALQH